MIYSCHYEILDDSEKMIEYVYHLSDIHIRNELEHMEEYKQVFVNSFYKLKKQPGIDTKKALITITGDIIHKRYPSKYAIKLMFELFIELSKLAPVLFIAGNHDCNMTNKNDQDIFTVLLHFIQNQSNVYYLSKTGAYRFRNIIFGVTDVRSRTIFKASNIDHNIMKNLKFDDDKIFKIALYHGTLNKAVTDASFVFNDDKYVNKNDFIGYDFVMLGDIHKQQYMNRRKTIAYAGSLIQQDHGESLKEHGFLKWEMKKPVTTPEFIHIKNEYGFYTIDMEKIDKDQIDSLKLRKKSRVRIIKKDLDGTDLDDLKRILIKKGNVIEITEMPYITPTIMTTNDILINDDDTYIDISSSIGIIKCIKNFLKSIGKNSSHIIDVCDLHKNINGLKDENIDKKSTHLIGGQVWEILELEFSNMFCYGDNNKFYFTHDDIDNKIIGIIAANHAGKSSILDIILYCLFDKCSRGDKGDDVMNKSKKTFSCSLKFRVNGTMYMIKKNGLKKSINKIAINLLEFNESKSEWDLINGTGKNDTKDKIKKLVGEYNDFLSTSICLQDQGHKKNIVKMTANDKTSFFAHILGLDFIGDCRYVAGKKVTELKKNINNLTVTINTLIGNNKLRIIKEEVDQLTDEIKLIDKNMKRIEQKKVKLYCPEINEKLHKYDIDESNDTTYIDNVIKRLKKKILTCEDDDSDVISKKICALRKKLEKMDHENSIESFRDEWTICNDKLIKLTEKCDSKLPKKIPIDELEELEQLNNKIPKLTKRIKKSWAKLDDSYDIDNEIDDTINELHDDITRLKHDFVNVKEKSNDKLLDKRDELDQYLSTTSTYVPLTDIEKASVNTKIQIKDSFKKICESDIDILTQIKEEFDDPPVQLNKMIKTKKKWILSYSTKRKKLKASLATNDKDFVERAKAEKRLIQVNSDIELNILNNKEYKKNKKLGTKIKNLQSDIDILKQIRKLIQEKDTVYEEISHIEQRHKNILSNSKIIVKIDNIKSERFVIDDDMEKYKKKYERYVNDISQYESQFFDMSKLNSDLKLMLK